MIKLLLFLLSELCSLTQSIQGDLHNKPWNGKAAAFSFTTDDGYREANLQWQKIFNEFGYRFTVFVIINSIGHAGILTTEDLNALHHEGHEIGSHSVSHCVLIKDSAFTIKYTGEAESAMIKIASDTLYLWSSLNENYKFYLKDSLYMYLVDLVDRINSLAEYECKLDFYPYKFWFCESRCLTPTEWEDIKTESYHAITRGGVSMDRLLYEIRHSKTVLESIIVDTNYKCVSFSYPFYANDVRTRIALRDSGNYLCARSGAPKDPSAPPIGSEHDIPIWDKIYLYEISLIHADVARLLWGINNSFNETQTRDSVRKYFNEWKKINAWIVILSHSLNGIDTVHLKWVLDEIKKDGDVWVETFGKVAQYIRETHYSEDGFLWLPKIPTDVLYTSFNTIHYAVSYPQEIKFEIYDVCGRKVKMWSENIPIGIYSKDLSFLGSGVYFLIAKIHNKIYHLKIIIFK